jgi:subtilisin family serine protease
LYESTHKQAWKQVGRTGFRTLLSLLASAIAGLSMSAPAALAATPNDPSFSLQWADSNTGQSIPFQEAEELLGQPAPGTPGGDDGALHAWGVSTGSRSIVIAETDTGVDYEHPDLAANIWSNPGGIGGCPAGTHGYDVLGTTASARCEPIDEDTSYGGHGTHVAGIMGAVGDNGIGVAGVNWQTTILPVKWLESAGGSNETGKLIEALQWIVAAKQAGVNIRVVNDSPTFLGTPYSQALSNEIGVLGENNILFVTAAGNTSEDDDELADRRYPCGYDLPNEICVTASNDNDELPSWANYGPQTVNLAAPGVSIYSTLRENKYGYLSGGSMASPQVAGAAALILSVEPSLTAIELKTDILDNVDPVPALSGKVITGGILDICKALPGCEEPAPPPPKKEEPAPPGNTGTPPSQSTSTSSDTTSTSAASPAAPAESGTAASMTTVSAELGLGAVATSSLLPIHDNRVAVKLRCDAGSGTCAGRLTLTIKTRTATGRRRVRTIGTASFSIPAGRIATIAVDLDSIGHTFWHVAHGRLSATLTILASPSASKARVERVRLT